MQWFLTCGIEGISTLHLVNSGLTRKKTSDEDLVSGDMKIKSEFIDGQYYGHAEGLVLDNDGNAFMFYSSGYDDGNCYTCFTSHYKFSNVEELQNSSNRYSWTFLDDLPNEVCDDSDCQVE